MIPQEELHRRLHHPQRVQPPGRRVGGRGRRQRRRHERRGAAQARRDRRARRRRWRRCDDRRPALHRLRRGERAAGQRADGAADRLRARPAGHGAEGVLRAAGDPRAGRRRSTPARWRRWTSSRSSASARRCIASRARWPTKVHDARRAHRHEHYDGDAGRMWGDAASPEELRGAAARAARLRRDEGRTRWRPCWRAASASRSAEPLVPSHPTLGDVDSPEALASYQAGKRAHKAALRASRA